MCRVRLLGFDIEFRARARRALPSKNQAFQIQLVRLVDGDYSVETGSIGFVEDEFKDDRGVAYCFVGWASGGSSGPIAFDDLVAAGTLSIPLKPSSNW